MEQVCIEQRPAIVEQRGRDVDREAELVIDVGQQQAW